MFYNLINFIINVKKVNKKNNGKKTIKPKVKNVNSSIYGII